MIARDLVEAHGGQLILESQAGEGCTFVIRLPLNCHNLVMILNLALGP